MNSSEDSFLDRIRSLVKRGAFKISSHAFDALVDDDLARADIDSLDTAEIVEFYPNFAKGPAILLLQRTVDNRVVHCVWGIPKGLDEPAVLVTAYIPDIDRWDRRFKERL